MKTVKKKSSAIIILNFVIVLMALLALILFSMKTGSLKISYGELFKGLFVAYDKQVAIIYDVRYPRIIISLLAGAALVVSGILLQAVMKNPLTDPGIIGISSGAALVGSLVTALFPALFYAVPALAVAGGMVAYFLIYSLAWDGGVKPTKLILVGVALNLTFTGIMEGIKAFSGGGSNLTKVQSIVSGHITQKTWGDVRLLAIYTIVGLVLSLCVIRLCNLLLLEDKQARALGVNVDRNRFIVALIAIVLASITTATVGVIGFLGLLVPHISRLFVGSDHKALIPHGAMLGAFMLLLSDTVGRTVAYPYEIPAAVIMAVVGGPFFIILLKTGGGDYGD